MRRNQALAPIQVLGLTLGYACVVTLKATPFVALEEQSPRNTHKALGPEIAVVHSIGRQRKLQANASCIPRSLTLRVPADVFHNWIP
jgi:hypothetical protein